MSHLSDCPAELATFTSGHVKPIPAIFSPRLFQLLQLRQWKFIFCSAERLLNDFGCVFGVPFLFLILFCFDSRRGSTCDVFW